MKYYVHYKVEARYIAEVEADSIEEAKTKADTEFANADFGVAEDIDGEAIIIDDEECDYVWEKE